MTPHPATAGERRREILHLALPALGTLAADPLLSMVDTALVGHLGAAPLAALALSVVAFSLAFIVFNFLAYGTTGPIARMLAAGEDQQAARYAVQAVWVALFLGITVTLVGELVSRPLGVALGAKDEVLVLFLQYFRIRLLALTPLLLIMVGHGVFRGLRDTRTPLALTVAANVVNALAAATLVYPLGLGVRGAAIATLAAQTLAALAFFMLGLRRLRPLAGPDPWALHAETMAGLLRLSRDLVLRTVSLHAVFLTSTAVAARMGTRVVAAQQVAVELWMFLAMVLDSLAIAAQALIARRLGTGASREALALSRTLVRWGVGFGVVLGAGYWALSSLLPRIFTSDPEILATVALAFPLVAVFQPLNGYVFVIDGILIGAGDARYLAKGMAASAALALPLVLLSLPLGWGIRGLWTGLSLLMIARAVTNGVRLHGGRWAPARDESGCRSPRPTSPATTARGTATVSGHHEAGPTALQTRDDLEARVDPFP